MSSVNKVILIGNAGRDAEVRYLPSGGAVANVSIATTSRRKDENGQVIEDTQWHRLTFYERLAEIAGEFITTGKQIYVEGRLKYGKYTDKDGVEKNSCDIVVSSLTLLGGGRDDQGGGQQGGQQRNQGGQQRGGQGAQQRGNGGGQQGGRGGYGGNQGGRGGYGGGQQGGAPRQGQQRQAPQQRQGQTGGGGGGGFDDMHEDIPF